MTDPRTPPGYTAEVRALPICESDIKNGPVLKNCPHKKRAGTLGVAKTSPASRREVAGNGTYIYIYVCICICRWVHELIDR